MDGVEEETSTSEEEMKKKKFREFWMGKLVKGFGEDLDVVRQVSFDASFSSLPSFLVSSASSISRDR